MCVEVYGTLDPKTFPYYNLKLRIFNSLVWSWLNIEIDEWKRAFEARRWKWDKEERVRYDNDDGQSKW